MVIKLLSTQYVYRLGNNRKTKEEAEITKFSCVQRFMMPLVRQMHWEKPNNQNLRIFHFKKINE